MITWIRWNLTKIIIGIVAVAVIAGGLYASGTLRQAKDANQAATVVDRIYDCETPECIKEIAAAYDADQLVALMSEVSSTNTAEVTQSTALRDSGGRCIIFGKAVGELYAELVTVKEIPTLIASIDMTPSDKGTSLAYRCQMGFVSSVGAALGKTLSVEEVTKALPTLCEGPSQAEEGKSRYRFETLDAICQLSATGHLVVQSVLTENDKATWKDFVNLCNAAGEFRVSQCLMAAQGAVRQAGLEDMVYGEDDCKESTRPAFCTMIATDAQVGKKMADIVGGAALAGEMEKFCSGSTDATGCRQGFHVGVWRMLGYAACDEMGKFKEECFDTTLTREAVLWTMLSDLKGGDIKTALCTLDDIKSRCEKIVDNIFNYKFTDGVV